MGDIGMYMENLDEYINDQNQVVTYKWLSIQLSIPCNTAKRLLYHFVTTHEKKEANEPLYVTYLVIGSTSFEDGLQQTKVLVVPHSKLEAAKQSLSSVSCVHVYSVSKSCLKDPASTLYTTDYDCVRQNLTSASKYGGIECPEAKARSDADIASLRIEATYRPSTPQDTRKAPDPRLVKPVDSEKQGGAKPAGDSKTAKPATGRDQNKPSAKGSLANMFAAQKTAVKKEPKENEAAVAKGKEEPNNTKASAAGKKTTVDKKAGRISGFFTKGANPREEETKNEDEESGSVRSSPRKTDKVKIEELETDSEDKKAGRISGFFTKGANPREGETKNEDEESGTVRRSPRKPSTVKIEELESDSDSQPNKVSAAKKFPPKKSPLKSASTKRTKGRPTSQPKRSRIVLMDSDSSEGEEDQHSGSESEPPAPPSPPPTLDIASSDDEKPEHLPPSPRAAKTSAGRGTKRKLVETTFTDDDGFLVTSKKFEDVTDSESEEPELPPPKKQDLDETPNIRHEEEKTALSPKASPIKKTDGKPAKKTAAKKQSKASPSKTKQASIMSFFKKK